MTSFSDPAARYDLIVVGLGAMGSAVVYHAVQMGMRVLGIDRYDPPHDRGSTKAETRITRLAVGEGSQYLPFVARSHEVWRDLERRSGVELLHQCGGYIVSPIHSARGERWGDFVLATAEIAAEAAIEFDVVDHDAFASLHPDIRVASTERIGFEPTAGLVMAERAVAVQLTLARADGAEVRTNERVVSIDQRRDHVVVETERNAWTAGSVVVATGPWMPEHWVDSAEPETGPAALTVTRQVAVWYEVDDLERFSTDRLPFFIWPGETIDDYVGAFPRPPGGVLGMKFVSEQFHERTDPDAVDRVVSAAEAQAFHRDLVASRFPTVSDRAVHAAVCLYTNTPDDHFLIDTESGADRVIYLSACSGHGFKHSTALGESVAQWVASGNRGGALEPFRRSRRPLAGD